jgi:all-trans-retinol 13,14-reductase
MKNRYHTNLKDQQFDAIIIGSGLGGLTAAALLAKSKKKVLILEKHYVPGGFTHTFRRNDYVWDVGVHYIGQMQNKGALMHKIFDYVTEGTLQWSSMGEVYDRAVIGSDVYDFVCGAENQIQNLIGHFPEEVLAIREYFSIIQNMGTTASMFFGEKTMPYFLSKSIGFFLRRKFYKYSDQTTYQVLRRLTNNEKLISVLCAQCGNYGLTPQRSSFAIQGIVAEHYLDGGNYPVGGASAIHKSLLQVIEKHGGVLAIKAEVAHIILKDNKATGVQLKNGDVLAARIIISNAGARNTFTKLLPYGFKNSDIIKKGLQDIKPSTSHICLYIGLDASDEELKLPRYNYWVYNDYDFDAQFNRHLENHESDPPLAYISFPSAKDPEWAALHPGKSTVQVIAAASYEWVRKWESERWQKRGDAYEKFKEGFKNKMLEKLYHILPQVKGHVAVCEVSTPLSTRHFTNHQEGEIYGLEHTPARFRLDWLRAHTPVKNLFLTGQDIITVGVGGALFSGVLTASSILKKNFLWHALRYKKEKKQPGN